MFGVDSSWKAATWTVDIMEIDCDVVRTSLDSCLMTGFDIGGDERSGLVYVTFSLYVSEAECLMRLFEALNLFTCLAKLTPPEAPQSFPAS